MRSTPRLAPRTTTRAVLAMAALLSGCDLAEFIPTRCVQGGTECGGECVDLEISPEHCGACGNACGDGEACEAGSCRLSASAACDDGEQDGAETDVDCGGGCRPCQSGKACRGASDCALGQCVDGFCDPPWWCSDGMKDGDEPGVDCGGSCKPCTPCDDGSDCPSGVCENSLCAAPSCSDHVKNGLESDVDCGGNCPDCAVGQRCGSKDDCPSTLCSSGICQPALCTDGLWNGSETDQDCGGGGCGKCVAGKLCSNSPRDCESGVCANGRCAAPSCTDRAANGDETDVDCGGSCPRKCEQGGCLIDADCQSNACRDRQCVLLTSVMAIVNGPGSGQIVSTPAGINCPGTCSALFPQGAEVVLTAVPAQNSSFGGWSQGTCSGTGSCKLTAPGWTYARFTNVPAATWMVSATGAPMNTPDLAESPQGDVFAVDVFNQRLSIGSTELTVPSSWGFAVLRISPSGQLVWARAYEGLFEDGAQISADAAGVTVVGNFSGTLDFGSGPLNPAGGFVVRLDLNGNPVWSRALGQAGLARRADALVQVGATLYVAGTVGTKAGVHLTRLETSNQLTWQRDFLNPSGWNTAPVLAADADGAFLAGTFYSSAGFDLGGGPMTASGTDYYLARFKPADGSFELGQRYGHASASQLNSAATSLAIDSAGRIALAGTQQGSIDFAGVTPAWASTLGPFFVVFDSAGQALFSGNVGLGQSKGGGTDEKLRLLFSANGDLLVAGSLGSAGVPWQHPELLTRNNYWDGFLLRYASDGTYLGGRTLGDSEARNTWVTAATLSTNGALLVVGTANSAFGGVSVLGLQSYGQLYVGSIAP